MTNRIAIARYADRRGAFMAQRERGVDDPASPSRNRRSSVPPSGVLRDVQPENGRDKVRFGRPDTPGASRSSITDKADRALTG